MLKYTITCDVCKKEITELKGYILSMVPVGNTNEGITLHLCAEDFNKIMPAVEAVLHGES